MRSSEGFRRAFEEQTLSIFKPVTNEEAVQRVNKILVGWGNYFQCGYPRKAFDKVNWYVRNRLYLHFNRKGRTGRARWGASPRKDVRRRLARHLRPAHRLFPPSMRRQRDGEADRSAGEGER